MELSQYIGIGVLIITGITVIVTLVFGIQSIKRRVDELNLKLPDIDDKNKEKESVFKVQQQLGKIQDKPIEVEDTSKTVDVSSLLERIEETDNTVEKQVVKVMKNMELPDLDYTTHKQYDDNSLDALLDELTQTVHNAGDNL